MPQATPRKWFSLRQVPPKAETDLQVLEVDLFDYIGYYGVSAEEFIKQIKAAGEFSALRLNVNSPGGSVLEGNSIYNFLLGFHEKVTAHVDFAASMASVISMAADRIEIAENGFIMIHNAWTCICGDAEELRKEADLLDQIKENIVRAYQRHTDLSEAEIGQLMDDETWMTGSNAVERGFAHEVTDVSTKAAACVKGYDLTMFNRVPSVLIPAASDTPPPKFTLAPRPINEPPAGAVSTTSVGGTTERSTRSEPEPENKDKNAHGVEPQDQQPKPPANPKPAGSQGPIQNLDPLAAAWDEGKLAGEQIGKQKALTELHDELNAAAVEVANIKTELEDQVRLHAEATSRQDKILAEKDQVIGKQNEQLASVRAGFIGSESELDEPTTWAEALAYFIVQGKDEDQAHSAARDKFPELFEQMVKDGNKDPDTPEQKPKH